MVIATTLFVCLAQLASVSDVLNCALKNHPDLKLAEVESVQAKWLEPIAKQIPNPELSSQSVLGKAATDETYFYIEFNLSQTIELGRKRNARILKAKASEELQQGKRLSLQEKVLIQTLLSLYRVRQIQSELKVLSDALTTFTRIRRQYLSRARRTPEQEATLHILEIAEANYRLKKAPLEAEEDFHRRSLEYALGFEFVPNNQTLPSQKTQWPMLSEEHIAKPGLGSKVILAQKDLLLAQAQLKSAQSGAWPDLKIGPTFEIQSQGPQSFMAFGLNFSLPLPIFHLNGNSRAYSNQGVVRSELFLSATQKEAQDQRAHYYLKYKGAVKSIQESLSVDEMMKKHFETEKLFDRGLVSGNLVIEIHRQVFEFTKTKSEQENAAIESLAHFYALEGRLFEEML